MLIYQRLSSLLSPIPYVPQTSPNVQVSKNLSWKVEVFLGLAFDSSQRRPVSVLRVPRHRGSEVIKLCVDEIESPGICFFQTEKPSHVNTNNWRMWGVGWPHSIYFRFGDW